MKKTFETTSAMGQGPQAPPPSPAPVRAAKPPARNEAFIGKAVLVKGQIFSKEDLIVDGQIEGTVELPSNRLRVGSNGKLQANVKAREVDVMGTVHGDIMAEEKITIRKEANLVGDLKSASIEIEDGAYFKGSVDIVRPTAKPADKPSPPSPAQGTEKSTAASATPNTGNFGTKPQAGSPPISGGKTPQR